MFQKNVRGILLKSTALSAALSYGPDHAWAWLDSPVADLNNVSSRPFAGAVVAALFMRRFLAPDTSWVHLDLYAWNDSTRPGRPEGGEAQAMRAVCAAVESRLA